MRKALPGLLTCCLMIMGIAQHMHAQKTNLANNNRTKAKIDKRIAGMLMGGLIGEIAGAPTEFDEPIRILEIRENKALTPAIIQKLADSLVLRPYTKNAAPYAQWIDQAPAGSGTDETRFRIMFIESWQRGHTQKAFAQTLLDWYESPTRPYPKLRQEWLEEIAHSAYWVLGDSTKGLPPERVWGGIVTMAGQMPYLITAGLYPGQPERAYKHAHDVNMLDNGFGKDITAALVAGTSAALATEASWESIYQAMRSTDPYGYNNTRWVERRFTMWLNKAQKIGQERPIRPLDLIETLKKEGQAIQWWEGWMPVLVGFALLEATDRHPLATIELIEEFGMDNDSYAAPVATLIGALHGIDIFPQRLQNPIKLRLIKEYGVSFDELVESIMAESQRLSATE